MTRAAGQGQGREGHGVSIFTKNRNFIILWIWDISNEHLIPLNKSVY